MSDMSYQRYQICDLALRAARLVRNFGLVAHGGSPSAESLLREMMTRDAVMRDIFGMAWHEYIFAKCPNTAGYIKMGRVPYQDLRDLEALITILQNERDQVDVD